ncbi:MAG: excinuclease ABC subunit UvrA, partial [Myxococcota bacterium]|nr:excinuclease ABC subunit UvrA [Myxococcota bacterium]
MTEIYHFMRLLYSKLGQRAGGKGADELVRASVAELIDSLFLQYSGEKLTVLAPVIRDRKGFHRDVFRRAAKRGIKRARVDGIFLSFEADDFPDLERYQEHTIELVVGEARCESESRGCLKEAVERALSWTDDDALVGLSDGEDWVRLAVSSDPDRHAELDPRLFSFNSKVGACESCGG